MKIYFTSVLLYFVFLANSQAQGSFERLYRYWYYGEGNEVFEEEDGYILAGVGGAGAMNYLFIMKTGYNGDTLWMKQLELKELGSNYPWITSSVRDQSGNTYFALEDMHDLPCLFKFDPQWNLLWQKKPEQNFTIRRMTMSRDNSILCVGKDSTAYCIRKLNTEGTSLWRSSDIYCNPWGYLAFSSIHEMPDNAVVLISSWINNTWYSPDKSTITVYSPDGDSVSSAVFNPPGGNYTISDTKLIGDEMISIGGRYPVNEITASLIRHKADGTILMDKILSRESTMYRISLTGDGKVVTSGYISRGPMVQQAVLQCMTLEGDSLWSSAIGYAGSIWLYTPLVCRDKGILLGGFAALNSWPEGYPYFVKTDSMGRISPVGIPDLPAKTATVYPNPTSGRIFVSVPQGYKGNLEIYDALGHLCYSAPVNDGATTFDLGFLNPGIYIYHLLNPEEVSTGKLIIRILQ